ncbi:MAG: hypothetical protein R8G01_17475 [Ilumatobacteraceae bacterium]|nr:hypothetical protein [Ilumatobacteraceae bacterium]
MAALAGCDDGDAIEDDARSVVSEVGEAADELAEDTIELAARNIASTQGAQQFESAGHPLDGDLACEADAADDVTAVEVDCTGVTQAGGLATLTGATSELPGASVTELDGVFVGTVDDEEVFRTERLGN